ncbi:integrase [Moellerella wisconsensis]|uniref:integrase n=1 Tax=Moellerella wisconsensis TaxID=158849 RepID=UPI0030760ED3
MSNLLAKLRELRGNVSTAISKVGTKTKQPIYDKREQAKLLDYMAKTQPDFVMIWWEISISTGWRTADVCRLQYSNIDFETGIATITVAKQSRAAESRAYRKGLLAIKESRKRDAMMQGDAVQYMKLDAAPLESFSSGLSDEEEQLISELVSSAPIKTDSKKLPAGLLKRLQRRQEMNLCDDYVFSRSQCSSNYGKTLDGHITRQAIWKRLCSVFAWFAKMVNSKLKLSAYSTRKTFAYNVMKLAGADGLLLASEALGHSNPSVTRRYLGLASKCQEIQERLIAA